MRLRMLVAAALAVSAAAAPLAAQDRQVIQAGAMPGLPFSPAVKAGGFIFLSGQIGVLPGTRTLADTSAAGQARQAMENIGAVLRAAGSSFNRVVKCTVFLTSMNDYAAVNAVYATYFPSEPPARSAMAASGLAFGAKVEIECIALA